MVSLAKLGPTLSAVVDLSADPELSDCVICTDRMTAVDSIEHTLLQAVRPRGLSRWIFLFTWCGSFYNQSLAASS